VQSFLYSVLADDNELAAKKSLAVLSELWRRHIWRDGRTVNCIGGAEGVVWCGSSEMVIGPTCNQPVRRISYTWNSA
jgi:hypothetical protein